MCVCVCERVCVCSIYKYILLSFIIFQIYFSSGECKNLVIGNGMSGSTG